MQVSVGDFPSRTRKLSVRMQKAHILILLYPLYFVPGISVVQGYVAAGPFSCHATRSR